MAVEVPIVTFTRSGNAMPDAVPGDTLLGHTVPNDGRTGLVVKNTDTAMPHVLTISLTRTVDGQAVVPRTVTVPASASLALGPFNQADYGADVGVTVDSASLTLLAFRVA
ncbi:hypothetical protein [Streptomyces sp. NRRL S-31]|uniref:hypothetical protein n=1 Tax=Streptomyces sp. NRRL S-31 TaxID=1463898 RepID=UPI00131DC638|nr:hypothetical protein [Streptomyces sp. NRRL S-31]